MYIINMYFIVLPCDSIIQAKSTAECSKKKTVKNSMEPDINIIEEELSGRVLDSRPRGGAASWSLTGTIALWSLSKTH